MKKGNLESWVKGNPADVKGLQGNPLQERDIWEGWPSAEIYEWICIAVKKSLQFTSVQTKTLQLDLINEAAEELRDLFIIFFPQTLKDFFKMHI